MLARFFNDGNALRPLPNSSEGMAVAIHTGDLDEYHELEKIADTAIAFGRVLMECNANVRAVDKATKLVVEGLGARPIGVRAGYASLTLTVSGGGHRVSRMRPVGRHGVNHQLDCAVRKLALDVAENGGHFQDVRDRLDALVANTPHYSPWTVAVFTGAACAAFGQLLGIDWAATWPALVAGTLGQRLRHEMLRRGLNSFVVTAIVGFVSSALGSLGAHWLGSQTVLLASIASTLLLVPGIPATNAQTDIMDGFPTVGSARAVVVAMVMVFASCGIMIAQVLTGAVR